MSASSNETRRMSELKGIYNSYEWMLKEDIKLRRWKAYEYRVNAMQKEMWMFAGKKMTSQFLAEQGIETTESA